MITNDVRWFGLIGAIWRLQRKPRNLVYLAVKASGLCQTLNLEFRLARNIFIQLLGRLFYRLLMCFILFS